MYRELIQYRIDEPLMKANSRQVEETKRIVGALALDRQERRVEDLHEKTDDFHVTIAKCKVEGSLLVLIVGVHVGFLVEEVADSGVTPSTTCMVQRRPALFRQRPIT